MIEKHESGTWSNIIQDLRRRLDELTAEDRGHSREINDLRTSIKELMLAQKGQLTPEQILALTVLLLMKDRQKWLWGRTRVYLVTTVGVIASIFLFKSWIAGFLTFLASLFKG
jgi:hypothetical protein